METQRLTKIKAARRQLNTAIMMWFQNGDDVSIHALAYAAYEVIDKISKKENPERGSLLYDSKFVKESKETFLALRKSANFFKHADKDPDRIIDFNPKLSEGFIFYSLLGVNYCKLQFTDLEEAYLLFHGISNYEHLTEEGKAWLSGIFPDEILNEVLKMSKINFYDIFNSRPTKYMSKYAPYQSFLYFPNDYDHESIEGRIAAKLYQNTP